MILSHEYKFIYIKNRKVASSTMEIALSGLCGPRDIITLIGRKDEAERKVLGFRGPQNRHAPLRRYAKIDVLRLLHRRYPKQFYDHMPAKEIKSLVPTEVWNGYFKFCFERNPWDKTISDYLWHGGDRKYSSIIEFLHSTDAADPPGFDLYSINGMVAVDMVYRYEDLPEALHDISGRLGWAPPLRLPGVQGECGYPDRSPALPGGADRRGGGADRDPECERDPATRI